MVHQEKYSANQTPDILMQVVLEGFLKEIRNVEGEKNHRVVDIWLLLIIHVNGGPYRKIAEQLLFKKICRGDIGRPLLLQCIQGRGDSLQVIRFLLHMNKLLSGI